MAPQISNRRNWNQRIRKFATTFIRWLRYLATTTLVVTAIVLCVLAFRYYEYDPWTRDGRVRVYVVASAPEVGGVVTDLLVTDNQYVHKGDVLFKIDIRDYDAAVRRTEAALDSAKAQLALREANSRRRETLSQLDARAVSREEVETFAINVNVDRANVKSAEAALYKAKVDLERCEVRSTVNGWITNLTLEVGTYAQAGHPQLSVVNADSYYIYAYFEETQLRNVRVGATARAALMGYVNEPLPAHVESIGRGISDVNAASDPQGLPAVNPIFTWVRLAQRIPVRLKIDNVPQEVHLAAGETCTVYVDGAAINRSSNREFPQLAKNGD
jgi:multidrug resistance efflux pump